MVLTGSQCRKDEAKIRLEMCDEAILLGVLNARLKSSFSR